MRVGRDAHVAVDGEHGVVAPPAPRAALDGVQREMQRRAHVAVVVADRERVRAARREPRRLDGVDVLRVV